MMDFMSYNLYYISLLCIMLLYVLFFVIIVLSLDYCIMNGIELYLYTDGLIAGFIANYISAVVISGFTSASAITIAMSQLKSLLGIKFASETFIHDLIKLFQHITETR